MKCATIRFDKRVCDYYALRYTRVSSPTCAEETRERRFGQITQQVGRGSHLTNAAFPPFWVNFSSESHPGLAAPRLVPVRRRVL